MMESSFLRCVSLTCERLQKPGFLPGFVYLYTLHLCIQLKQDVTAYLASVLLSIFKWPIKKSAWRYGAFICILSSSLFSPINAQKRFPTNDTDKAFMEFREGEDLRMIDTGLSIQEYINLTLTGEDEFGMIHLGNLGAPTQMLLFDYHKTPRLQWGMNPYPVGRQSTEDVKYFNVKAPLVTARYVQGYDRGQSFDINARLNVHERLNYNIRFQRLNSNGNYLRQLAEFNNFTISYNYRTSNDRLRILGHFDSFSRRNQENGGVQDITGITENLQPNRELVQVRLDNHRSATKQRRFYTTAQYDLGYFKIKPEDVPQKDNDSLPDLKQTDTIITAELDSLIPDSLKTFVPLLMVGSSVEYNRYSYVFNGPNNNVFFDNTFFDLQNTYDSTRFETFEQRFFIGSPDRESVNWLGGAGYEFATYGGLNFTVPQTNVFVFGNGQIDWRGIDIKANSQINLAGTQIGNFLLEGEAGYKHKDLEIAGVLDLSSIDPGIFFRRFLSNHFVWENPDFSPVNHQYLGGRVKVGKWLEGHAGYHLFQNYTTLNQQAVPQQFAGVTQLVQAVAKTKLNWGKRLGWQNDISYQLTNDALGPIRVPELYIRSIMYTNFKIYYNRLNVMPGVEAHYFTNYYAPDWMPATGMFHLQDDRVVGNFPYFNFFINFELKRALIFLKVENITQEFLPREYFIAPAYPLPDFVVRLGIKWDFYN